MNPIRKQRLYALIAILIGSLLATWLVVSALSENMNLFYSPTEIQQANLDQGTLIRAGGMVKAGSIIVLQCGTRFHAGKGVGVGNNYTLYATVAGRVAFEKKGKRGARKVFVSIVEDAA